MAPMPSQWLQRVPSPQSERRVREPVARDVGALQGYLTHKKMPNPLGPPYDPRHRPTVGPKGDAFSYPLSGHAVKFDCKEIIGRS